MTTRNTSPLQQVMIGMCCDLRVLVDDVKESRNDNPTRDLQMATDRT